MSTVEIKVPDIGDFKDVPIIEVFVKPGDAVKAEDPLIALESDKATMDVPSPSAGTVKDLKVKVGDRVSQGKVILVLDAAGDAKAAPSGGNGQSAASAQSAAPAAKPPVRTAVPSPSAGPVAVIHTSVGDMRCQLFDKEAPIGVANFIGLANGTKDWTNPVSHA